MKDFTAFAHRIGSQNHSGAFFCKWYKRSLYGTELVSAMTPRHPVPFKFVTGSKEDTKQLVMMYVSGLRLSERSHHTDLLLPYLVSDKDEDEETERRAIDERAAVIIKRGFMPTKETEERRVDCVTRAVTSMNDETEWDDETDSAYLNCSYDFSDPANDTDMHPSSPTRAIKSAASLSLLPSDIITDDDLDGAKDDIASSGTRTLIVGNGIGKGGVSGGVDMSSGIKYHGVSSGNKRKS